MSQEWVTTKAVLIEHINRDWTVLNALLNSLSDQQWTEITNADGWTVKDHVAHLAVWEQSVIALLDGLPRHIVLGVPESVYLSDDEDAINAMIFANHRDNPLDEVRARFRETHNALITRLARLTDADLNQSYAHYLPDERDELGPPTINIIYGNTAHHFRTHQRWIEEMLRT
jgi:uncharacterized protein (TIGR03083 family)